MHKGFETFVSRGCNFLSKASPFSMRCREKSELGDIPHPYERRFPCMKSSTKDRVKGSVKQAKGAIKEGAGRASGDANMRDRGTAEKVSGKIQKKVGEVKKVFGK